MELLSRVRRTIRRHGLAGPESRVVLALSGGCDSVALVHLLMELHRQRELRVVAIAHFNHQLRSEAEADERFSGEVAASFGYALVADRGDVARLAGRDRISIEHAARRARHAFLERTRQAVGADVVATGHTRDDQAETFLLRLLRGAGSKGLGSMYPKAGAIVRPLIDCRRAELQEYLATRQQPFVHDTSNDDVSIPRNRIRSELLPLLEQRFNPAIVDVLAAEAAIARDEHHYLERAADILWSQHVRLDGDQAVLDAPGLAAAPLAVSRLVLRRAMLGVANGREVTGTDAERAIDLVNGDGPDFDGPGQRLERIGDRVVLTGRRPGAHGRVSAVAPVASFRYELAVPGVVEVNEAGRTMTAEIAPSWNDTFPGAERSAMAVVQFGGVKPPLAVRNRRAGDRFSPLGLGGRKKLQDFFVDRKVGRLERDRVPLVVDATDRIVWVAGHAIDEAFRVTNPAQAVIILRLKGVGGSV
jgi:tRNA(Ile)-lysidine synthase